MLASVIGGPGGWLAVMERTNSWLYGENNRSIEGPDLTHHHTAPQHRGVIYHSRPERDALTYPKPVALIEPSILID
jgi:hypothetical protein